MKPWDRNDPKPKLSRGEELAGLGWILFFLALVSAALILALIWTGAWDGTAR